MLVLSGKMTSHTATNVISAYIPSQGILIEFDADTDMGGNLMWGFGITLSPELEDK